MSPESSGPTSQLRHDDKLGVGPTIGLTLPRLPNRVEWDALDVEPHISGNRVSHKANVVL